MGSVSVSSALVGGVPCQPSLTSPNSYNCAPGDTETRLALCCRLKPESRVWYLHGRALYDQGLAGSLKSLQRSVELATEQDIAYVADAHYYSAMLFYRVQGVTQDKENAQRAKDELEQFVKKAPPCSPLLSSACMLLGMLTVRMVKHITSLHEPLQPSLIPCLPTLHQVAEESSSGLRDLAARFPKEMARTMQLYKCGLDTEALRLYWQPEIGESFETRLFGCLLL